MNIKDFFDNLNVFFIDENVSEDENSYATITATAEKDKNGKIIEIRIVNNEYDEFLIIDRDANIVCINIEDEEKKSKKEAKKHR